MMEKEIERVILREIADDYIGLWEVYMVLEKEFPRFKEGNLTGNMKLLERVLMPMVESGKVKLFMGDMFNFNEEMDWIDDEEEIMEIITDPENWSPDSIKQKEEYFLGQD